MLKNDEYYMELALMEAKKAYDLDEVPIGAVIVNNDTHDVVATAHNLKELNNDVSAHAEILAIQKASKKENNWRLENHTIYVTLEPCTMCASAILQSRMQRVVFAIQEPNFGGFGGLIDLTKNFNSKITVTSGVCSKETKDLLAKFFDSKR